MKALREFRYWSTVAYIVLAFFTGLALFEVQTEAADRRANIIAATEKAIFDSCQRDNENRAVLAAILEAFRGNPENISPERQKAFERSLDMLYPLDCAQEVKDVGLEKGL